MTPSPSPSPSATHQAAPVVLPNSADVRTAVLASNVAWMQALRTASPLGLESVKTGANLQSLLQQVALLRVRHEYWRISVQQVSVLWSRVLDPTDARALLRKSGESRRLFRIGRATPVETDYASYTNLYDLRRIGGHWLVTRVTAVSDATAAGLIAAPPTVVKAIPRAPTPTASPSVLTPTGSPTVLTPTGSPTVRAHATATSLSTGLPLATATPLPTRPPPTASPAIERLPAPPTATPIAERQPALAPAASSSGDPLAAVRAFYADLTAGQYDAAFALLTPRLQALSPTRSAWRSLYADEAHLTVTTARVISGDSRVAIVALTLQTSWLKAPYDRRFVGTWLLRREPDGWRLDRPFLNRADA